MNTQIIKDVYLFLNIVVMNVSNDPFSDEFSRLDRCGVISDELIKETNKSILETFMFDVAHLLCFSRDVTCCLAD